MAFLKITFLFIKSKCYLFCTLGASQRISLVNGIVKYVSDIANIKQSNAQH